MMPKKRENLQESEWYLEYQIHHNRPGILGDISSLLGMLQINIKTINGVESDRRGMLLEGADDGEIELVHKLLSKLKNITVTKIRKPRLRDRLAIRHGRYIIRDEDDKNTFRFVRDELGILVDFLGEIFKRDKHQLIGVRGLPRIGKTEAIIASSVCANKRWVLLSSTLLRRTLRSKVSGEELSPHHIYLIDGIVSTLQATEEHRQLVQDVLLLPATKVIEHPDIFVRETEYTYADFDYMIELRSHPDEEITYDIANHSFTDY